MFIVERLDFSVFLLRSFLLGAFFAGVYLLLGFERILFAGKKSVVLGIIQIIFDLIYCILLSFCDILMIYCANRGQIRIIALLVQVAGFVLIYLLLKKKVIKAEEYLIALIMRRIIRPVRSKVKEWIRKGKMIKFSKKIDTHIEKDLNSLLKTAEEYIYD